MDCTGVVNAAPLNSIVVTGYDYADCEEHGNASSTSLIFPEEVNNCISGLLQPAVLERGRRPNSTRIECLTDTTYIVHNCDYPNEPIVRSTSSCYRDEVGDQSWKIDCAPFINGKVCADRTRTCMPFGCGSVVLLLRQVLPTSCR